MNNNYNYCHVVGRTDIGHKRAANEDSMANGITQNGLVAVVCDGMGGHVGGATASQTAVTAIMDNLTNNYYDDPRIAIGESIDIANRAILNKATVQPELRGMGSTCVLLIVRDGKVYIGHVGDSRIYLIRSKRIVQLTKDHSYVQMLVDSGSITKEEAERHPRKNEITNAMGIPNMSPATVAEDALIPEAGDCFFLCSDGLSGMVSDQNICKVVSKQAEMTAQQRVDALVNLANENGGVDNITVEMVEFSISPDAVAKMSDSNKRKKYIIGGICLAAIVAAILAFLLIKPNPEEVDNTDETIGTEATIEKPDTTNVTFDAKIKFKENGEIIELEFADNAITIKHDKKQIHQETNIELDPASLVIVTDGIKSEYSNHSLVFGPKAPEANEIVFLLTTKDKKHTRCYSLKLEKGLGDRSFPIKDGESRDEAKPGASKDQINPPTPPVKNEIEIIPVKFTYDSIEKGDKLIFNYSATAFLRFNNDEHNTKVKLTDININNISYPDDLGWKMENKRTQIIFTAQKVPSTETIEFSIPCIYKDTSKAVLVKVMLVKEAQAEPDGNVIIEQNPNNVDKPGSVAADTAKTSNVDTTKTESVQTLINA